MKNISLFSLALALSASILFSGCVSGQAKVPAAEAEVKAESTEKVGFLTTDKCAAAGEFTDCYLENYACGSDYCFKTTEPGVQTKVNLVLFSHAEGLTYKVDASAVEPRFIDKAINRSEDSVIGVYNAETNTIVATEIKGPPPPKKSFFKGCL